jgi:5-methylcytosine-specific restriction enzyme subunit McrC
VRDSVRTAYRHLPIVSDIRLSERAFRSVQLHRNIGFYRFLLDVCRLLYDCLIPDEGTGQFRFRDFTRDEEGMCRLFERFLFHFYRHEQRTYEVGRSRFGWAGATGPALNLLPTMHTDVTLRRPGSWLVIDAKYTPQAG